MRSVTPLEPPKGGCDLRAAFQVELGQAGLSLT